VWVGVAPVEADVELLPAPLLLLLLPPHPATAAATPMVTTAVVTK
jgi:hypothetical protein